MSASRVLVVDDSLTVRMDIAEALAAAGFDAVPCGDLRSARAAMRDGAFDLVVLDVVLPDGDGIDFLREVRQSTATASIRVMLLSTRAEVESRVQGIAAGADDYIGKPYHLGQLVARARAMVGRARRISATGRARVLVIDDSATFRGELVRALGDAGYGVDEAATGEEGLVRAAANPPDAIVVDGMLPGIDGVTVIRRLKSDVALRDTPCLLLTAAEGTAEELRSLEAGADVYERKSDDVGVVLARLAALLRGAQTSTIDASASLLGPKRLLAVDDSPTYLDQLGDQLRREGYDVVLSTSGEQALELLAVQPVDCILLDLVMPGMSGLETCRRIKRSTAWREIPLVMLTAREDRETMIDGINAGADDYIAKSADFDVLKARLRAQLRRKHFEDENRRIREKLVRREIEARFQRLIQSNIIGVFLADRDGRVTEANDAFLAMIDYTRAELDAGAINGAELTPVEWGGRDAIARAQLHETGSATPFEKEYIRKGGGRLPIVLGMVQLEGTDTIVGFVLDRTEQKEAESRLDAAFRELAAAKERAETESRFKSKFLASMSHELRTPLNAIIGFSEILEQGLAGDLNPQQLEFVGTVLQSSRHLLALINEVLDLSKIEAGRMELACQWCRLGELADAVHEVIKPLASKSGVALSITIPADFPELHVDPIRIKQVLFNLLSNAIKFTPNGGAVELVARAGDATVDIACIDTGTGIAADDLPRLFREFEQIGARKPEGTGLGLALTRRLVELHGGTIDVTSAPGQGSTFTVRLPWPSRS